MDREAVHVSTSTISVALSKRLTSAHQNAGQDYMAAPVFGRPEVAREGKLWIAAAGAPDTVVRVRPALEAMSRGIAVVGIEPAAANAVKICGNFLIAAALEACGEAFALAERHGVERDVLLEMTYAVFGSPVYARYGACVVENRWHPARFNLRMGLKDVHLALEAAEAADVPVPIASLLRDNVTSGIARGFGDLDWSVIGGLARERAGFDIRSHREAE